MSAVTVSPKFQVVIPKDVREATGIQPGQKVEALAIGSRIELVPIRPISEYRGMFPGIDTRVERDPDRV
jgi:AbrB family looped-hinge helix DNA binding protein